MGLCRFGGVLGGPWSGDGLGFVDLLVFSWIC